MFETPHDENRLRNRFTRRMLLLGVGQAALVGVLGQRLHKLQIVQGENYASLADDNRLSVQPLAPVRGQIFDRDGQVLAANRDEHGLVIVPDLAGDTRAVLEALSELVAIPREEIDRIDALSRSQNRVLPIDVRIALDWETLARINVRAPYLPGVLTEVRKHRVYGGGEDFGHILGYVGLVSKHRPGDDPALRLPSMKVGKTGVEGGLDDRLRGTGGSIKQEINARGQIVRKLDHIPSLKGGDVTLSIDSTLQKRTMSHVASYGQASAVALNVKTGEILSMASAPSYDPAQIVDGISQTDWDALQKAPGKPLTNRAIRGQYPPGSTFKMVTALAALDAGVVTPDERFTCRGSHEYGGRSFGCWNRGGHGRVNLHRAIRESCDIYFYQIAERVGIEKLAQTARRLGFGETFETGLAGEKKGVVPDPAWKLFTYERPWLGGETLLAGIGQGYVSATPLQLAVMTARIATGRAIVPTIEKTDSREIAPDTQHLGFEQAWLNDIRKAMTAVVNEAGGTGSVAQLNWPGIRVAGKTGTSQVSRASRTRRNRDLAYRLRDHSLFVAYAPVNNPRYAVAAVVDHGGGGSQAAAPLAREVMAELFRRETETSPDEVVVASKNAGETPRKKKRVRRKRRRNRRRRKPSITRLFVDQ